MNKEYVIKIGKQYVKRCYYGSNPDFLAFGFTTDVGEAKLFKEKTSVVVTKNQNNKRFEKVQTVSSDGLEYANMVAEELGGKVYEIKTEVTLTEK